MSKQITWAEVEATKTDINSKEKYLVIHNKVYDIGGDFVYWHPGGKVAFSQLARDASGAFDQFHTPDVQDVLANYYVGDIAESDVRIYF